jgi:hypothetical protein
MSEIQRKKTLIDTSKTPADLLREIQETASDMQNYQNSSTFHQDAFDAERKVADIMGQFTRAVMVLPNKDERQSLISALNENVDAFINAMDNTARRFDEESKQKNLAKLPRNPRTPKS